MEDKIEKTCSAVTEKGCTNSTNLHTLAQLQARVHMQLGFINQFFPHNSFCLETPIFPKIMIA